jgi:hypothetical protein
MGRQLLRSAFTLGVMAALGAAVLAFSTPAGGGQATDQFVAVGSTNNNANPSCNGKKNSTCTPVTDGPVKDFGLTVGPMVGIYPTGSKHIPLTFSNPHNFDIVVKTVAVQAADASSTCSATHLQRPSGTVALASPVLVPKNGTAAGPSSTSPDGQVLRVTMLNTAPDQCQGVSFPISVTAMAEKR